MFRSANVHLLKGCFLGLFIWLLNTPSEICIYLVPSEIILKHKFGRWDIWMFALCLHSWMILINFSKFVLNSILFTFSTHQQNNVLVCIIRLTIRLPNSVLWPLRSTLPQTHKKFGRKLTFHFNSTTKTMFRHLSKHPKTLGV